MEGKYRKGFGYKFVKKTELATNLNLPNEMGNPVAHHNYSPVGSFGSNQKLAPPVLTTQNRPQILVPIDHLSPPPKQDKGRGRK